MARKEAKEAGSKRYYGKPCKYGHGTVRYTSTGNCVECCRLNAEKWLNSNKEKSKTTKAKYSLNNKEKLNKQTKEWHKNNKQRGMLKAAKTRSKALGIPFNLSIEDIAIPDACPIFGISLFFTDGGRTDNTPSLDKIKPELGYVKGNVRVVSWRANRLKCDGSLEEFESIVRYLKENT